MEKYNFDYLRKYNSELYELLIQAENYKNIDPQASLMKLGHICEKIVDIILEEENIEKPSNYLENNQSNKIMILKNQNLLPYNIEQRLTTIRKKRNEAIHYGIVSNDDTEIALDYATVIVNWFISRYSNAESNSTNQNEIIDKITSEDLINFDGKSFKDEPKEINVLNEIVVQLSKDINILNDADRTRNLLLDSFSNNYKKVNILMSAYNEGIIKIILENDVLSNIVIEQLQKHLSQQYSLTEENAKWCLSKWMYIVNDYIKGIYRQNIEETSDDLADNDDLLTRQDNENYYVNVKMPENLDGIFVPCGIGNSDYGFVIKGLISKSNTKNSSLEKNVYALVYNFFVRNSCISYEEIQSYIKYNSPVHINYRNVFRLIIIVLQMIKRDFAFWENCVYATYVNRNELEIAIHVINYYATLFSRITKIEVHSLVLNDLSARSVKISLDGKYSEIFIENMDMPCNARDMWFGEKIKYNLSNNDRKNLEMLLLEISPYKEFKEGQFEALCKMLNDSNNKICIMPTGSGKSLIYYMASLLQPLPVIVISPTEILIKDQIDNLKRIHRFDNVSHWQVNGKDDFSEAKLFNNLIYLTPTTFQNRHLLVCARHMNLGETKNGLHFDKITSGAMLSYLVLDEVHCLSNLGHDFRPEYLMLSQKLLKFLDCVSFWGFTATANYTVAEDLQKQLNIKTEDIFSPVEFNKQNISYNFRCVNNEEEMISGICAVAQDKIYLNERTIIFTKDKELSYRIAQKIGHLADVFESESINAYKMFAEERSKVLVTNEQLGIGINFPNVKNIIHCGLPLSKSDYIQEIGRAGRANESVSSYVFYLVPNDSNVCERFFDRIPLSNDIIAKVSTLNNDYGHICCKLTNGFNSKQQLLHNLLSFYSTEVLVTQREFTVKKFDSSQLLTIKRYLYILFVMGCVQDWYSYSADNELLISTKKHGFKETALEYFIKLGNNQNEILKIQRATNLNEILEIYVEWYFSTFLYTHKEAFLDLYDFISNNHFSSSENITDEIKAYYSLSYSSIKKNEDKYLKASLNELVSLVIHMHNRSAIADISRINGNEYNYNLDCTLLIDILYNELRIDENRLKRIINVSTAKQKSDFINVLEWTYDESSTEVRLLIIQIFKKYGYEFNLDFERWFEQYYNTHNQDIIYLGYLSKKLNQLFDF